MSLVPFQGQSGLNVRDMVIARAMARADQSEVEDNALRAMTGGDIGDTIDRLSHTADKGVLRTVEALKELNELGLTDIDSWAAQLLSNRTAFNTALVNVTNKLTTLV